MLRLFSTEALDKALGTCYYPALWGLLAQLVEQLTLNQRVIGSNPIQPTILSPSHVFAKKPSFDAFLCVMAALLRLFLSEATLGGEASNPLINNPFATLIGIKAVNPIWL